jgi:hypothetical protein
MAEPTWDSSASSSPEPEKELSTPSDGEMPESNLKLVDGGKTYVLASTEPAVTREQRKSLAKRRQSGHRREFHNVSRSYPPRNVDEAS